MHASVGGCVHVWADMCDARVNVWVWVYVCVVHVWMCGVHVCACVCMHVLVWFHVHVGVFMCWAICEMCVYACMYACVCNVPWPFVCICASCCVSLSVHGVR